MNRFNCSGFLLIQDYKSILFFQWFAFSNLLELTILSYCIVGLCYLFEQLSFVINNHCSRAKTVNENLRMSAALLSRFDLVFILLDKPDELLDKRVSDHIMAVSHHTDCNCCGALLFVHHADNVLHFCKHKDDMKYTTIKIYVPIFHMIEPIHIFVRYLIDFKSHIAASYKEFRAFAFYQEATHRYYLSFVY